MEAFIKKLADFERARRADLEQHGIRRFQFCYWYEKLWRMRWLLMIPVWTFRRLGRKFEDGSMYSLKQLWSVNHGWAHHKMEYWHTGEEVEVYFKEKFGDS